MQILSSICAIAASLADWLECVGPLTAAHAWGAHSDRLPSRRKVDLATIMIMSIDA